MFTAREAWEFIWEQISKPFGWCLALFVATAVGLFWFKMNARLSNMTSVVCIFALGVTILSHPRVAAQPLILRILVVVVPVSICSLISYHLIWVPKSKLGITATASDAQRKPGESIGGIIWSDKYLELNIALWNPSRFDYEGLDIIMHCDKPIALWGNLTDSIETKISFFNTPTVAPEWFDPKTKTRTKLQLNPVASTIGIRIRCDNLPSKSRLDLIFAIVSPNDFPKDKERDAILCINYDDGSAIWLAGESHSEDIFGDRPAGIKRISFESKFRARNLENQVKQEIAPRDFMGENIGKIPLP